jgi:hypothetical protein
MDLSDNTLNDQYPRLTVVPAGLGAIFGSQRIGPQRCLLVVDVRKVTILRCERALARLIVNTWLGCNRISTGAYIIRVMGLL